MEMSTDVVILGAGTAGMYAMREVRRAGKDFLLVDPGPLGTTCARVGCMPSKVALHAAAHWDARRRFEAHGIQGAETLRISLRETWAALRRQRDRFTAGPIDRVRSGAGARLVEGRARFLEPTLLEIDGPGETRRIRAGAVVIATGSRPVLPAFLNPVRDLTVTTDGLFELEELPASVGILGLGAIGLEMGLALARLGVRVVGADLAGTVAGIVDPEIARRAIETFGEEFPLWLGAGAEVTRTANGVLLRSGERSTEVDLLLAALGRRPNVDGLGLAEAGIPVDARGVPAFDPRTMRVGDLPVFIAGDADAERPLMHEAADEGAIAGYNAARGLSQRFARKTPLAIAFTAPDVVAVGARLDQLDPDAILIGTASSDGNGRSRIMHGERGLLRVYADRRDGRLLGAAMVAIDGEHLAHLLAWAIQRGETAHQLLDAPFYHPVVEELLQSALQDLARQLPATSPLPLGLAPEEAA